MTDNVSLVIVSHSTQIASGTTEMVRQMVGDEVNIVPCGGDLDGGLGTNVAAILGAIQSVYSNKGVLIMVDLGGAETNSEMAIEMMQPEQQINIQICDAPIVEGSVMAATEASGGASLADVRNAAEEYMS